MKKPFPQHFQLVDQSNALTMYLDALLNEVEVEEEGNADEVDMIGAIAEAGESIQPVQHSSIQSKEPNQSNTIRDAMPLSSPMPTQVLDSVITSSKAPLAYINAPFANIQTRKLQAPEAVRITEQSVERNHNQLDTGNEKTKPQFEPPHWAKPRFQVLTFSLSNMQMAAPLDQLNGIIPLPEQITSLPGQSSWFFGLTRNRDKNVQIIDLAKVIKPAHQFMSEQESGTVRNIIDGKLKYILLIDDGRWGILCDSISTVLTLEANQVNWRQSLQIDFILGTVVEKMHSVLSVERLITRLNSRSI